MIVDVLGRLTKDVKSAITDGHYRRFIDTVEPPSAPAPSLLEAVRRDAPHALLAEVKPASPSRGDLSGGAGLEYARSRMDVYRRYGVTGISVLTERDTFQGSLELLREAALGDPTRRVPVLMKDFVVDPVQLEAAAAAGASAVLLLHHLIVRGETPWDIDGAIEAVHAHGLEALYEVDNAQALDHALSTNADLIGINNRDLSTLEMDLSRTPALLRHRLDVIGDRPVLALSGVDTRDDLEAMRQGGAAGVLVGTSLMEAADARAKLRDLLDTVHVKCCGSGHINDDAQALRALQSADAVGVVVDAGGAGRERTIAEAAQLFSTLPFDVERFLVTTNTNPERIAAMVRETGATGVQLHVELAPDALARIRGALGPEPTLTALQCLPVGDDAEAWTDMLFDAESRAKSANRLLLDATREADEDAGGTGRTVDREAAARIVLALPKVKVVLAGGLDPTTVADAIRFVRPFGVDVSSGIERKRGYKDAKLVEQFITQARSVRGIHEDQP